MYAVSEEYKKMITKPSRCFSWSGKIVTKDRKEYLFENKDIVKGSGYVARQCSGSSEIELGTVYSAELGISLFSDIDRYTLEDARITLDFHLQLEGGGIETIPMGVFYIAEANRRVKTLEIKAYDSMLKLDKSFNKGLSSAQPYDFLSILSKSCKVELAQTKEEIEALTNGEELFGIYQENDIETWRDFLFYLAQALGCFATIDRHGKLLLVPFKDTPVKIIDSRHRFTSSFSDFVTRYTAVSSTNKKNEKAEYFAKEQDDGLTMNLGVNPLLQFGLEETRKRILKGILEAVSVVEYVPFDSDTIGDPALDLGDVLQFTGGHADGTKKAAITAITTRINGKQSIKCVGKNPKLAEAKSKNDKNLVGLLNSIGETRQSIYTFTNALALEVGAEKTPVINIEFASGDKINAEFNAQCVLKVTSNQSVRTINAETAVELAGESKVISFPLTFDEDGKSEITVYYVLDGHEIEQFHPKETWLSGNHLLALYYPLMEMEANQMHTFEVLMLVKNGKAHIDGQNIMATISGQGLGVQDRWDGRIKAEDTLKSIAIRGVTPFKLKDNMNVHMSTAKNDGLADSLGAVLLSGVQMRELQDELRLFSKIVQDVIGTEDRKKMEYNRKYVIDEDKFSLRKDYTVTSGEEKRLNRGRMTKLTIPTEELSSLTEIEVLPFETLPFVNAKRIYSLNLALTDYMEIVDGKAVLKGKVVKLIYGRDMEIDRGRLAAFKLDTDKMKEVDEMEVANV